VEADKSVSEPTSHIINIGLLVEVTSLNIDEFNVLCNELVMHKIGTVGYMVAICKVLPKIFVYKSLMLSAAAVYITI